MKTKKGFTLRTVCGENIIVAEGLANIDFGRIISLNESAAYLWKKASEGPFNTADLASWLTAEYEVDEATALSDSGQLIDSWRQAGIIEDD